MTTPPSLTSPCAPMQPLKQHMAHQITALGGWMGFDTFMDLALYTPGMGYYANDLPKFGALPGASPALASASAAPANSDFVTAPEMTPLFGYALARQVAQALHATDTDEVWEFGAGTGALAQHLLAALTEMGVAPVRYTIVEVSTSLRERQRARLAAWVPQVQWASALPQALHAVVLGNELLDAMPVQLLVRKGGVWHERGVALEGVGDGAADPFVWSDRPTTLRPSADIDGEHDYLTEIHPRGEAFVRTLGERLVRGAAFLLDYGFPQDEYYHPQRHMGTVMCHRAHQSDIDPLADVGFKDITAHVNFTGLALAAQDAGLEVLGYTNQAHFLMNCGLVDLMQEAALPVRVAAQKLILEHEMGELFKVIALGKGPLWQPLGFAQGDKTHRL